MPWAALAVHVVAVKSRHREDCKHKDNGNKTRCSCPKQLEWCSEGKEYRMSADTCDYGVARVGLETMLRCERYLRRLRRRSRP
jgi:hypothetical protein